MQTTPIRKADLEKLAASDATDLAEVVVSFVEQDDPTPDTPAREGVWSLSTFQQQLQRASYQRSKRRRIEAAREAWQRFLAQTDPPPPPRFEIADMLVGLYERRSEQGRASLLLLAKDAPLVFGIFGGLKRIYKRAEEAYDFELFASLAVRFDLEAQNHRRRSEGVASRGTLVYLRRRAWRYVRSLALALPRLYALLAAQVLARVPESAHFEGLHIASNIVGKQKKVRPKRRGRGRAGKTNPPVATNSMPFEDAWKLGPEPLLYLIEAAEHESAASFAITLVRKHFPDVLRSPNVEWLERLCYRPVEPVHELLVELLASTPELHQAKLRERGLHDGVLALLTSPCEKARTYAIAYARAHAADMPVERLLRLADESRMYERFGNTYEDTVKFATEMLTAKAPRDLGIVHLGQMLEIDGTQEWAKRSILKSFGREDVPESWLVDMIYGGDTQRAFALEFIEKKYPRGAIGPTFFVRVLDDPRQANSYYATREAMNALGKVPLVSIDAAWLLSALTREGLSQGIAEMLQKADALPAGIDVAKLKELVFHPKYREIALQVLGNSKLVSPRDLGLGWLLALAKRADVTLHDFAHRILLQSMKPADFDENGKHEAGVARLFALASGAKEPEPVRAFAQTYLRCHHPILGPAQAEAKALGLKAALDRDVYTAARVWPMLYDDRADVRKFGIAIARAELRAWGYHTRVYELGDSPAKEVRTLAHEALLGAGDATADPSCTLAPEELSASGVLGMAESREQRTREVAMELFRRHYQRLGGADKLGWLMQSADREVQRFAVRILWEKHRPRALPDGYKPPKSSGEVFERAGDFTDLDALRTLLRSVLLTLPPGRSKEARDTTGRRRLPASIVKRNVVEIVRDLGLADAAFAQLVVPILSEMVGSAAKGEQQACLATLAHLDRAHPGVAQFARGGA